jgi:hypothetical protein
MLGRTTFTGKKPIKKSSDESITSSKRLNAIHLKESASLNPSNMPYQDTGQDASMMSKELSTKPPPIRFI